MYASQSKRGFTRRRICAYLRLKRPAFNSYDFDDLYNLRVLLTFGVFTHLNPPSPIRFHTSLMRVVGSVVRGRTYHQGRSRPRWCAWRFVSLPFLSACMHTCGTSYTPGVVTVTTSTTLILSPKVFFGDSVPATSTCISHTRTRTVLLSN